MTTTPPDDYTRVERALRFLHEHRAEQPGLDDAASHVGLSPFHFQRLFSRWVGISPKRFVQYLTAEHARACLTESRSVLDAVFETGLSSPGRLHDLTVSVDAMTPGELRARGDGVTIRHGVHPTPFGSCLLGVTERGVCWLSFHDRDGAVDGVDDLRRRFADAELRADPEETASWCDRIFDRTASAGGRQLSVLLAGTNFRLKVWEALLRIPAGHLCCYGDLAELVGRPSATRAVASAVAANTVAYLIPCHRVIRSMGDFGQYRWGAARKRALIGWEQVKRIDAIG